MPLIEPKHPVLVLPFRNGELHCCHLDGYGAHKQALLERLQAIEATFTAPTTHRVWLNLDESALDAETMAQIAQSLARLRGKIVKLALVGLGRYQRTFEKRLVQALSGAALPRAYFADAELAKEWLV